MLEEMFVRLDIQVSQVRLLSSSLRWFIFLTEVDGS